MARLRVPFTRRSALGMLGAGLLLLGTACAPKVYAERTPGFALESAQTYAWVTDDLVLIQMGADQPNIRTQDNEKRIRAAIEQELQSRGFSPAPREQAEVLVAFSVGVKIRYRLEGGDGTAVTTDGPGQAQTKGTLNIYLLDRAEAKEIWHGWVSKWLSKNDDPQAVINNAVSRIMTAYPNSTP